MICSLLLKIVKLLFHFFILLSDLKTLYKLTGILLMSLAFAFAAKSFFIPERIFTKNVNLEHGLSQCVVTDVAIDKKGFLWIGTLEGLNRYDGSNVSVFKHNQNDKNSLPSSKILKMFSDDNSHLWLKTTYGLTVFDTRTGKIVRADFLKQAESLWVCRNDSKSVWLYLRSGGLMKVNTADFSYLSFENKTARLPLGCEVLDMYKINKAVYMVTSCGDIVRYDEPSKTFTFIQNTLSDNAVFDNSGLDKNGDIYLGSQQTDLMYYSVKESVFRVPTYNLQNVKLFSVRSIHFDATNNVLLLGTYGQGLFVYDYATKSLKQFKKNDQEISLTSNYIQRVISDNNGVVYIGYDGMGVDILDPFVKKFVTIKNGSKEDFRSLHFVRKIVEDDRNTLLIGTSGSGLVKYDRESQKFTFLNDRNFAVNPVNFIIDMIRVKDELWVGYNGGGVDILDIQTLNRIGHFSVGKSQNEISDGLIWSFMNDNRGNIWIGTRNNGLNMVNIQTRTVKQFTRAEFPVLATGMRSMMMLRSGNFLVATEDGLLEVDGMSNKILPVFPIDFASQVYKSYKSIYIDHKERIWLATDGMGLLVISKDYRVLNNFNTGNSLNNDVVYGILPENDSTFWISSNAGISCIQWNERSLEKGGTIQTSNYDEKNGLQAKEFNTGAYTLLRDGRMAFGGINGVNVFNPKRVKNNLIVPIVYINEFKVFENVLKKDTLISYLSSVNLKPFENSFSITFGTIGFSLPGKTQYRYRLVGNDEEWINAGGRNYVSYTNLKSGAYSFQVKACNYDGVWNDNYTTLNIHIDTPFYKTWWFSLLLLGFTSQIIYIMYRYRLKVSRDREKLSIRHTKQIAELEMKALRAQINPHFLFNSLNSINSYILKNDNKMASRYLVKFSQLVRNILNNSSIPFISLSEELNTIELYMHIEGMRFNNQFTYLIDVEQGVNTSAIRIPSLLLQPYVENAIWHGLLHKDGEKNIAIRISKHSLESVCIRIEDNGVGRKMAAENKQKPGHGKSYGMQLGEDRLKLMNYGQEGVSSVHVIDNIDEKQHPNGTTIEIIIATNVFVDEKISLN